MWSCLGWGVTITLQAVSFNLGHHPLTSTRLELRPDHIYQATFYRDPGKIPGGNTTLPCANIAGKSSSDSERIIANIKHLKISLPLRRLADKVGPSDRVASIPSTEPPGGGLGLLACRREVIIDPYEGLRPSQM